MNALCPAHPPATTEAGNTWQQVIRASTQKLLTPEVADKIVQAVIKKAESGDLTAVKYLFGDLHATPPAVPVTLHQENHYHPAPSAHAVSHLPLLTDGAASERDKDRIVTFLLAAGEATPQRIATDTGLELSHVVSILDEDPKRFLVQGELYRLDRRVTRRR